eukprot:329259-Chlamydomonas_euryale.AAC.6
MVEKTVMDAIPVQAIWSLTAGTDPESWQQAAGLYIGGDINSSPYERANKRANNFGTFAGGTQEALANQNIVQALNSPSASNAAIVDKNLKIIYGQASIRYTYLLDRDLTSDPQLSTVDHRAEGQAFYRIIAPFVKQSDASCDEFLTAVFDEDKGDEFPSGAGGYYCLAVLCIPRALGLTAAELGTLEGTEDACPGAPGVAFSTPVGSFSTTTNAANEAAVSVTTGFIKDLLSDQAFAAAEAAYNGDATLSTLGSGSGLSGPVFTQAQAYFGSGSNFNEDYLSYAFARSSAAEKMEMVEKTTADAIPVQAILSYANSGANGNRADWDKAGALYIGNNQDISPYGRANKRARNFGTQVNGEAAINQVVLQALQSPSRGNYDTILNAIKVIYAQASIRYAYLLDTDLTSEPQLPTADHRAEGQAFYRIVAPMVAAVDATCDQLMTSIYNIDGGFPAPTGRYYCQAVECIPAALGISSADLGTLEGTDGHCDGAGLGGGSQEKCSGDLSDGQWAGIGIGIAVPTCTLILIGAYFLFTMSQGYRWLPKENAAMSNYGAPKAVSSA